MNNLKVKIRTLLTALILATLCSSFFVTDIGYAKPAAKKICNPGISDCPGKPSDYLNSEEVKAAQEAKAQAAQEAAQKEAFCKSAYGKSCAEYEAANAAELKAQQEAKAQAECQKLYGTNCAQGKLNMDPNSLVEGTFSVTENLKLDNGDQPKKYFNDNSGESPIVSFILTVINFATTIMGSFAVILFIIAGFMFMVSGGNSQKLDEAKDVVKYAAIGLIVAFMAYVITIFVQSIFSNG